MTEEANEEPQNAEFPDLSAAESVAANAPSMELIRDIPVELTVQLRPHGDVNRRSDEFNSRPGG